MALDGMVPDGVRALKDELSKAQSTLESAGNELWSLLLGVGLATAHADTIRRMGGWAGSKMPDLHRRVLLLERLVAHDPKVKPDLPVFIKPEMFDGRPLPTVGGVWDRLLQDVQSTFDLDQNSGNPMAEMAKGAVESTAGLAGTMWDYSELRRLIDRDGWLRQAQDTKDGIVAGVQNPWEFLKGIVDWETWVDNPNRALGRLGPDILIGAATGGLGGAASVASRMARVVSKMDELLKVAKANAGSAVAPARIKSDGSWEWKNLTLSPEANRVADRRLAKMRAVEPQISSGVQAAAGDLGAEMSGFPEHVLKGPDRFKEKLAKAMENNPHRTPEDLSAKLHDGIRYTFTFSEDRYAKGVADTKKALEQRGFELVQQIPNWSEPGKYKGVNTRWRGPDGQLFELQIHTPSSLWAKEVTHEVYEYKKKLSPQDRARLEEYEKQIFEAVPVPRGARDIPEYTESD
ncbi:hypothetical protein HII36_14035 [Nonomuraea sp. NN258]|uniref:hypothetical protein n=1 Tax=Nonomuraea antri TaxID=2730852 RepID=UPI0015698760|nr:hypothetical protein [Nonomuraea antri]NRQ32953.1 hypothetical protein [Nonomuraea antri]